MPHLSGISRILTSPLKLGLHFQSFKQHLLQVPLQGIWSCYIFSGRYFWNLGASLHDSLFLHLYMTEKIITYGWCQTQLSRNIALLDHSCINLSALLCAAVEMFPWAISSRMLYPLETTLDEALSSKHHVHFSSAKSEISSQSTIIFKNCSHFYQSCSQVELGPSSFP